LLVGVPRTGTTYEKLYDILLGQLSRFVTPPNAGDEWWKTPAPANGDTPAVNGKGPFTRSDRLPCRLLCRATSLQN
jgi:hypothetical protein